MGAMNQISLLAHDCGLDQFADIEELKLVTAKKMLGARDYKPELIALGHMLKLPAARWELAELVHVTKEQALALRHGTILHHIQKRNADHTPMRVRVSGKCRTWKTRPEWELPVKYGMYESGRINADNCGEWYVA